LKHFAAQCRSFGTRSINYKAEVQLFSVFSVLAWQNRATVGFKLESGRLRFRVGSLMSALSSLWIGCSTFKPPNSSGRRRQCRHKTVSCRINPTKLIFSYPCLDPDRAQRIVLPYSYRNTYLGARRLPQARTLILNCTAFPLVLLIFWFFFFRFRVWQRAAGICADSTTAWDFPAFHSPCNTFALVQLL
jgi:hypothetical protein